VVSRLHELHHSLIRDTPSVCAHAISQVMGR
jgi:hypothetical protein